MKNWLQRFMAGRHGSDELSFTLLFIYLGVCIIAALADLHALQNMAPLIIFYAFFRILSRNDAARRAENDAFLTFLSRLRANGRARRARRQDKEHRYFRCKNCGAVLRVPRGVGKIEISCPKCGKTIQKKA